jgi:hypothetical protein
LHLHLLSVLLFPTFSLDREAQTNISYSRTADPDDTIKWPRGQPADAHHVRCHHRTDERRVFRNAVHDLGQQGCSEIIDARGLDDDDEEENAVEERLPDPTIANGAVKTVSQKPTAVSTAAAAVVEIDELDSALSVEAIPAVAPSMPAKPAAWLLEQLKAFQDKRLDPSTQNGRLGSSPMARPTVQTVQTQAPKAAFAFASKSQTGPLEPSLLPRSPTKKPSASSVPSSPAADWAAKVRKYNFPVSPPTSDTVPEGEEKGQPVTHEQDCVVPSSPTKSKGEPICLVSPSPVDRSFPSARHGLPSPTPLVSVALPTSPIVAAVATSSSPAKRTLDTVNDDNVAPKRRRLDVPPNSQHKQACERLRRLLQTAGNSLATLGESLDSGLDTVARYESSLEAVSQIEVDFKAIFTGNKSLQTAETTLAAAVTQLKVIAQAASRREDSVMSMREARFMKMKEQVNTKAAKLRAQRAEVEERQALLDIREAEIEDRETDLEIKLTVADDMAVDVGEATGLAKNLHID